MNNNVPEIDVEQCQVDALRYASEIMCAQLIISTGGGASTELYSLHHPRTDQTAYSAKEKKRYEDQKELVAGFFHFLTADRTDHASLALRHQAINTVIQPVRDSVILKTGRDGANFINVVPTETYRHPSMFLKELERVIEMAVSLTPKRSPQELTGKLANRRSPG